MMLTPRFLNLPETELLDLLSERELEVLRLLARGSMTRCSSVSC
jgi:DNA-binding NarL/FixJ family response regulator